MHRLTVSMRGDGVSATIAADGQQAAVGEDGVATLQVSVAPGEALTVRFAVSPGGRAGLVSMRLDRGP